MENEIIHPPGLIVGSLLMSNEQYHSDTSRISKSGVSELANTPAHFYAKYLDPFRVRKDPTPAMVTGTIVHTAILEPEELERRHLVAPDCDKRTKDGKDKYNQFLGELERAKVDNPEAIECSQKDMDKAKRCRDSAWKHLSARELLAGIITEHTFYFIDPDTGAKCRIRPDGINQEMELFIDVKTTEDASVFGFGKSAASYEYDIQDPFYLDGFHAATGKKYRGFAFIAIEKEPPYAVGVYAMDARARSSGRQKYKERLALYQACLKNNHWPAYSDVVERLWLPEWAYHESFKNNLVNE